MLTLENIFRFSVRIFNQTNTCIMKKIIFFSLLSFTVLTTQAQIGIKGGLNLSNWHGKEVSNDENTSLAGFYFGLYGNVVLYRTISLQSEVVFSEEGVKLKDVDEHIRLNYLNIAELVRYNVTNSRFFVGTGPQIGFLLCAFWDTSGKKAFLKDEFKLGNFSWAFAAGYDLKCGLGFYARYNLGLSNILAELGSEAKQSSLQVGLRYNFKTKMK